MSWHKASVINLKDLGGSFVSLWSQERIDRDHVFLEISGCCFTPVAANQLFNICQLIGLEMLLYEWFTLARHVWDQIQFLIIFAVYFSRKQSNFLTPLNEGV